VNFARFLIFAVSLFFSSISIAAVYAPDEDVMSSGFFQGTNQIRGYVGDVRPTFRVSTSTAFGIGREAIYLDFSSIDLSSYNGSTITATLTMTSTIGGFGADASAGNPFTVSAHGVDTNPLTNITDDGNGGTITSSDFYDNNILAANVAASTSVDSFGLINFDVTALITDWISGVNTLQFIALTGKNHTGADFLHGFHNNSDTLADEGFTYLEVTAVPLPAAVWLFASALIGLAGVARRKHLCKS
jgi:hypothetical protein